MAKSSSVWTASPSRTDRQLRGAPRKLCVPHRYERRRSRNRRALLRFDRKEQFQPARAVVLCANVPETPKLLLNSETNAFRRAWQFQRAVGAT